MARGGRLGLAAAGTAVALAWALASVAPVLAQTASPAAKGATVEGEVSGGLEAGASLTFSVDATMPGGWEALHLVEIDVRSGGDVLETIRYDIEDVQLTVGDQRIVVGTGGVAAGSHLAVSGADVIVTTGAANLSFEVSADVRTAIPTDATFELRVVDDLDAATSTTASITGPASPGVTWETVLAFVAAALFVGAFVGNLFASKRRPPVRPSIYATVQRRLDQERTPSKIGDG